MMKNFLIFASVPLALFVFLFVLPRMFAVLINSHSDVGIIAVVMIVCGIFGVIVNKIYNVTKENDDEA